MHRSSKFLASLAALGVMLVGAEALADDPAPPVGIPPATSAPPPPAALPAIEKPAPDTPLAPAAGTVPAGAPNPPAPAKPTAELAPAAGKATLESKPAAEPWYRFRPQLEMGFLAVLSHRIQFGRNATDFDLAGDGGQDNLFFTWRASIEVELARRHHLTFLYQPLQLDTRVQLAKDLVVDEARFERGTPLKVRYGFPFYRFSYMYDFFGDDKRELTFGLSAQIRNATIEFESGNGEQLKSYRNIGFVPLFKTRGRYNFDNGLFVGHEIDAVYAPIRGANGSDNEVTGALVDASLRLGVKLPLRSEAFLNVRYLGGGATGQSDPETFSDGYTRNWLHFMTVSLGATISSF